MKFIIIDSKTGEALYGFNNFTLQFSSDLIALEVANQFFESQTDYTIVAIKI